MNPFNSLLTQREERPEPGQRPNGEDTRSTADLWMDTTRAPAERLVKFERWLRALLAKRLVWPTDPRKSEKQVNQCSQFVLAFVRDLERRGWLFDGKLLARIITEKIDAIARYQKAGEIDDLWPYFKRAMETYAGTAAEELRAQAMSAGCHISQIISGLKTLPEIEAARHKETLREQMAQQRRKDAAAAAEKAQGALF